jgi:hypothetical protein
MRQHLGKERASEHQDTRNYPRLYMAALRVGHPDFNTPSIVMARFKRATYQYRQAEKPVCRAQLAPSLHSRA